MDAFADFDNNIALLLVQVDLLEFGFRDGVERVLRPRLPCYNVRTCFNHGLVTDKLAESFIVLLHHHEVQVFTSVLLEFIPDLAM